MTTILLARHGETEWNRARRWQGHADPPLNERGRAQARALAQFVADGGVDAVYSSDLRRARETAEIVGGVIGLPVTAVPELREIDVGEWSGLTTTEIEERFPDGMRRHAAGGDGWTTGETHAEMSARIVAAVTAIAARHGDDDRVLCVLHGGTIRAVLAHAHGLELDEYRRTFPAPLNGSVAAVRIDAGRFARADV